MRKLNFHRICRGSGLLVVLGVLFLFLASSAGARQDGSMFDLSPPTAGMPGPGEERAIVSAAASVEKAAPGDEIVVAVVLDVLPGFHAQSHEPIQDFLIPFEVALEPIDGAIAGGVIYPEGHIENYPALVMPGDPGDLSVYTGRAVTYIPVKVAGGAEIGSTLEIAGRATFQICDDKNCFQPQTLDWSVSIEIAADAVAATGETASLFDDYDPAEAATAAAAGGSDDTEAILAAVVGSDSRDWSAGWAFLMAICAGLIFNIMPCVLPVLPIKAWGFYEVANHNRAKSFRFGLIFAAGLISVFLALAILILPLKWISWGSLFSNPWFVWSIVTVLVILAFGLFGAFTTGLPDGVYRWSPRHDTVSGNFSFGILTAILATPCTAPLLPGVLLWAATKPTVIGVLSVTFVGVGMSLPYVFLSLFPHLAKKFPRTGPWPELFKQMLGFLMLTAAAYFAGGRLFGAPAFWWLPLAVIAIACLFMIVRTAQLSKNALPVGVASTLAVVAIFGSIALTPLSSYFDTTGGRSRSGGGDNGEAAGGDFIHYDDAAFEAAKASGKPVLVKFTANWCITCQAIERTVFSQDEVWSQLAEKDVAVFKVDLTNTGAVGEDLLKRLNPSGGIPLTAIWIPGREEPVVLGSLYTASDLSRILDVLPSPDGRNAVASN